MKKALSCLLMAMLIVVSTFAQTTYNITVGEGTEKRDTHPALVKNKYSLSQNLYYANDINFSGTIKTISWHTAAVSGTVTRTWTVYIGETNLTQFSLSPLTYLSESDLTEVYSGTVTLPNEDWFTITLDTPYEYTNESNLVIAVMDNTGEKINSGVNFYGTKPGGLPRILYARTDDAAYTQFSQVTNTSTILPNLILGIESNEQFCFAPVASSIASSNITATSATISWTDNDPNHDTWKVYYRQNDTEQWDFEQVSTTTATLELNPNTKYYVKVAAVCGEMESDPTNTINFTTPVPSIALPYEEDFENADMSVWKLVSQSSVNNWVLGTAEHEGEGTYSLYVSNNEGESCSSTSSSSNGSYQHSVAILKAEFPAGNEEYHLSFDYKVGGMMNGTSLYEGMKIYMVNGDVEVTGAIPSNKESLSDWLYDVNDWTHFDVMLPSSVNGNSRQILFAYKVDGPTHHNNIAAAIDNVKVYAKSCAQPVELAASEITDNSANISWTEAGSSTSWKVEYKKTSDEQWQQVTAIAIPLALTGLESNTSYQVRVYALCGEEESTPSATYTFKTECGVVTSLPLTYGFESSSSVDCLTILERPNNSFPSILNNSGYSHTGSCSWEFRDGSVLVAFPKTQADISTLRFKIWAKNNGYSGLQYSNPIEVGYLTDASNVNSFVALGEVSAAVSNQYAQYVIPLNQAVDGENARIAMRYTCHSSGTLNSWYMDDITIEAIPACPAPSQLASSDITSNSATISWNESGSANEWTVYYKKTANSTWIEETASTNPWTIYDLDPNTQYQVKVAPACPTEEFETSEPISFKTACGAIVALPWTEDLESFTSNESNPACWKVTQRPSSYNDFPKVYVNYGEAAHSGKNSMEFKGGSGMILLPEFEEDIHNLRFSFWATYYTAVGSMKIGVVTDEDDMSTFELVAETTTPGPRGGSGGGNGTLQGPFSFANVQAQSGRIALKYENSNTGAGWNIDDFTVEVIPDCELPENLVVTSSEITHNSATISWTSDETTYDSWDVFYRASDTDAW